MISHKTPVVPVAPFGGYSTSPDPIHRNLSHSFYPVVFFEADPTPGNNPASSAPASAPVDPPVSPPASPPAAPTPNASVPNASVPNASVPNASAPKPSRSDIDAAVNARIAELLAAKSVENDPMAALTISTKQIYALEQEIARLKAAQGQLPEEARAKVAYVDEAGGLDRLKQRVLEGDNAVIAAASYEHEKAARAACEKAGLDYEDLSTRKGVDDWKFEIKGDKALVTIEEDGRQVQKDLAEHAKAQFPTIAGATQKQPAVITRYGKSAPAGGGTQLSVAQRIRNEEAARKVATAGAAGAPTGGTSTGGAPAGAGNSAAVVPPARQTPAERLGMSR